MNVVFQTTNKKRNSTAQVTGGSTYTCKLKTGCGVLHPVITLQWDGTSSPTAYNYCTIQEFGRSYWIDEWTYDDRQWTASCSVDTLGTYKTEIGTTSKYILRAEDAYDVHVRDTKYPAITPPILTTYPISLGWVANSNISYNQGYFVVGIVASGGAGSGSQTFNHGGATYVQMSADEFGKMIKSTYSKSMDTWDLMGPNADFGAALKQFGKNLYNTVSNPLDYITSLMWFPFSFTVGASPYNICLGPIVTDGNAYEITSPLINHTQQVPITAFTEVFDWEKIEPYVNYKLVLPPFGTFTLDAREVSLGGGITVTVWTDCVSGLGSFQVHPLNNSKVLACGVGQVGTPVAVKGVSGAGNAIISGVGAIAGTALAATTSGASAAIGAATSGIASVAGSNMADFVNSGYSGGIAAVGDDKALYQTKYHHIDQNPHEFGYPLCDYQILGGHSGFLLCADPEIELTGATPYELEEVGEFLVGGFYYE